MSKAPYVTDRKCYDADSHLMETFDWLAGYADPDLRADLPELHLGGAGRLASKAIEAAAARRADSDATAKLEESVIDGPKGWAAFGATDPSERSRSLDRLGFDLQLVFSTFAGTQFLRSDDVRIRYGGARAHNRGMADFCASDPRLLPVAIVPLDDPERAAVEVAEAIRLGCRAVWVPAMPAGERSPGHPDLDPVWACLAESRVPFVLHIGATGRPVSRAYFENGRPRSSDWLGGGENLRAKDFMAISHGPELFLSAMLFDGVLSRFPQLRGGAIELGAGWVPSWLARLDDSWRMFQKTDAVLAELEEAPSAIARRQLRFTPFSFEDVGAMIRVTGPELYLFSSDFPHPEGGRDPVGRFDASLAGLGEDVAQAFYHRNFAGLMSLADA